MSDGIFDDQNNHFPVSLIIILVMSVSSVYNYIFKCQMSVPFIYIIFDLLTI